MEHNLKYQDSNGDIIEAKSIDFGIKMVNFGWGDAKELKEIKPILRPLSDLDNKEFNSFYVGDKAQEEDPELTWIEWQFLFENHFDVFHLIPRGAAININTLKQTS